MILSVRLCDLTCQNKKRNMKFVGHSFLFAEGSIKYPPLKRGFDPGFFYERNKKTHLDTDELTSQQQAVEEA